MNPPYSQPGVWMEKLQAEIKSKRVTEAIALVPAATDTKWLSPVLKSQPVCFWTGRIKFLSEDYQPRNSARQSHVLVYWGLRSERFREVFEKYGVVYFPISHIKLCTNNQVLGENKLLSIPPSTKLQDDNQIPEESKSGSNVSNKQVGNISRVLGGNKSLSISPSTHRKHGEGSGNLFWGYANANSSKKKPVKQLYFEWEYRGKRGKTYVRSHLKERVISLNEAKVSVLKILKLLTYNPKVKNVLEVN